MIIAPPWNSSSLFQPAFPMPPQSSIRPSSIHLTHSGPPTSLKSSPFILHLSVALISSLLTFWPFPPWLLLVPCLHRKAYRQSWPWRREHRKLRDYKKKLVEKKTTQTILMAKFEEYTRFRSLCTSHTDFLHQQLTSPFLLPTPHIIGKPLEFLVVGIEHVASWSEMEGRLGLFSHWKEEL